MPPLLELLRDTKQSITVLPNIFYILSKENYVTTTQFRDIFWPHISRLCQSKELPAQSLYLLLKNSELILKFVSATEFNSFFMPLISKSLECGVPKLQMVAISKVSVMFKKLDYSIFKTNLLPRVLIALEKSKDQEVKVKILETLKDLQEGID